MINYANCWNIFFYYSSINKSIKHWKVLSSSMIQQNMEHIPWKLHKPHLTLHGQNWPSSCSNSTSYVIMHNIYTCIFKRIVKHLYAIFKIFFRIQESWRHCWWTSPLVPTARCPLCVKSPQCPQTSPYRSLSRTGSSRYWLRSRGL